MKYCRLEDVIQFTWDQVVAAFWQRYPNPYSTHVISEDVIDRRVEGSVLKTKRVLFKTNRVPQWAERFVGGKKTICILEESIIDLTTQSIVTYTRNIGSQKIMSVAEKCFYSKNPDGQNTTLLVRQVWSTSGVFGFSNVIATFGIQRFRKNAHKAMLGFNHVLQSIYCPEQLATDKNKNKMKQKVSDIAKQSAEKAKAKIPRLIQTSCSTER